MTLPNKFIQLGCWNNMNYDKNNSCIYSTMNKLRKYLKEETEKPNFIVVSGDNYYPDKETILTTKKKYIYPKRLIDGFNILKESSNIVPIYMLLGNHDLETGLNDTDNIFMEDLARETPNNCTILAEECKISTKNDDLHYLDFKSIELHNNTLLLMIDTNIYTPEAEEKYLPCYKKFLNDGKLCVENKNIEESKLTIEKLQTSQFTKISTAIKNCPNDKINNIIITENNI